jgi:hypothetical protein
MERGLKSEPVKQASDTPAYDPETDSAVAYARAVRRSLGQYEGLCFIDDARFDVHGRHKSSLERRR